MLPTVGRSGAGCVAMDQVKQHCADPGTFNGGARRAEASYSPTMSLICTMGAMSV